MYDALEPYLTTNMTRGRLINESVERRATHARARDRRPWRGRIRSGTDGFMQFYVDEAALEQTVLAQFYEKLE